MVSLVPCSSVPDSEGERDGVWRLAFVGSSRPSPNTFKLSVAHFLAHCPEGIRSPLSVGFEVVLHALVRLPSCLRFSACRPTVRPRHRIYLVRSSQVVLFRCSGVEVSSQWEAVGFAQHTG